jgi:large subunit ribosomal protein L6
VARVERNPLTIPAGVDVSLVGQDISVKGAKGTLKRNVHSAVSITKEGNLLKFLVSKTEGGASAIAGTMRALVSNMVVGVHNGFERKLMLVGVGYRAQVQGEILTLSLGFSHTIKYPVPRGVVIETPSQNEVLVKGVDKQLVGQVAAEIRSFRPPEPYKGKGVRYENEVIVQKEGKKK